MSQAGHQGSTEVERRPNSAGRIKAGKLPGNESPIMAQWLSLFGPPPLIAGEDGAAYDELLARFCAAVKPVDIIDEMFIADIVPLEWEVLRLRRLKSSLIRARGLEALEEFFGEEA